MFVCYHCERSASAGQPYRADKINEYGAVRPQPVRSQVHSTMSIFDTSRLEEIVDSSEADVDLLVVNYHSLGMMANDHVEHISHVIGSRSPALVLVLTCWTNPEEQTSAMRTLALKFHHTLFLTYRDPELSARQRLDRAIPFLHDTILFPHAPPFTFLARLCESEGNLVMFAACGSRAPTSAGPLRAVQEHLSTPGSVCSSCQAQYSARERWRAQLSTRVQLPRRRCRREEHCADMLLVRPHTASGVSVSVHQSSSSSRSLSWLEMPVAV